MNIDAKDVLIRMLATPNPYAFKFVLNVPLKNEGRASFYSKQEVEGLPLLHSLFDVKGVKQIFVFQNQLTVSHDGTLNEEELEKQVTSIIGTRIVVHDPDFKSLEEQKTNTTSKKRQENLSPELIKIEQILDRTIRPGLRADGGDLEVISFKGDEIRVSYQGACGGCPSAMMGTLEAIEGILRHEMEHDTLKIIPV